MDSDRNRYSISRFTVEEDSMPPNFDPDDYTNQAVLSETQRATIESDSANPTLKRFFAARKQSVLWHTIHFLLLVVVTTVFSIVAQSFVPSAHLPASVRRFVKPYCNNVIVTQSGEGLFSVIGGSKPSAPFNYALKQCGAQVLSDLTFVDKRPASPTTFLPDFFRVSSGDADELGTTHISITPPDSALNPVAPENCWEFQGTHGQLGLALVNQLNITFVSVDYNAEDEIIDAPRSMVLWGLVDGRKALDQYDSLLHIAVSLRARLPLTVPEPSPQDKVYVPLAAFEYNPYLLTQQQYFPVFKETMQLGFPVGIVVVQVLGNWGGGSTRLCGVSIHGVPVHESHE